MRPLIILSGDGPLGQSRIVDPAGNDIKPTSASSLNGHHSIVLFQLPDGEVVRIEREGPYPKPGMRRKA